MCVCVKPITISASRDHSCFALELSDGRKRENYEKPDEGGGGERKLAALRPNFADIVPRLIAKIPPSLLASLMYGSVTLQGKREVGF